MLARRIATATAFLLSMVAPITTFAAPIRYEFHAVDPIIEVASGDAFVADLLRSSAPNANLHGVVVYDREQSAPIVEFSGSAWGVSFNFPNTWMDIRSASSTGWGTRDWATVGSFYTDSAPTPPSSLGEHRLMLTGLQFSNDPPWVSDALGGGGGLPLDLSLLVGVTGLLEMCFDGSGNYYTCLFIHGVEVTEVPLPAGGGSMLSALAGLVALRRYRRQ